MVIESMLLTTLPVILSGVCPNHLKGLLKHRLLGLTPEFLIPLSLELGLTILIFNKFLGDFVQMVQGTHFENLSWGCY